MHEPASDTREVFGLASSSFPDGFKEGRCTWLFHIFKKRLFQGRLTSAAELPRFSAHRSQRSRMPRHHFAHGLFSEVCPIRSHSSLTCRLPMVDVFNNITGTTTILTQGGRNPYKGWAISSMSCFSSSSKWVERGFIRLAGDPTYTPQLSRDLVTRD